MCDRRINCRLGCFLLVLSSTAFAQVPTLINYRGHLEVPDVVPAGNVTQEVLFQIYDADIGGNSLWSETQSVEFFDGNFSVLLGSVTPVTPTVFSADPRYVGVTLVGETELSPRQRIASVPFSMLSQYAADASSLAGGVVYVSPTGDVGIRTQTTTAPFTVQGNTDITGDTQITGTADISGDLVVTGNGVIDSLHVGGTGTVDPNTLVVTGMAGFGTFTPSSRVHITYPAVGSSYDPINIQSVFCVIGEGCTYTTQFMVNRYGNTGIGTASPAGKLDVNGSIYQRGSRIHADYVFEEDYELESIEEHAKKMWDDKHLPALPPRQLDDEGKEMVEIGQHQRGMLEELEKAHIYIEQLNRKIAELEAKIETLEASVSE